MDTITRRQVFLDQYIDNFPLRYGGWAISEDILFDIVQYCHLSEPRKIVDLGTGTTSVFLGMYAKKMQEKGVAVHVYSFDSDQSWLADTKKILDKVGVHDFVDLTHAPITKTKKYGLYYDTNQILQKIAKDEIDLVIVDGPPRSIQADARYPAIPLIIKNLSKEATIFLDDANRAEEKSIAKRWANDYNFNYEFRPYQKGLAVLSKKTAQDKIVANHSSKIHEYAKEEYEVMLQSHRKQEILTSDIASKVEKIYETQRATLKGLERENEKSLRKNTQLERELCQKNTSEFEQLSEIESLELNLNRLRTSKSFLLGNLFFRSIKSPLKLLTSPWNAYNILSGKVNNTAVSTLSKKYIPQVGRFDRELAKDYPLIVGGLINQGYVSKALNFADAYIEEKNIPSISIFKAQSLRVNDQKWIDSLNEYLYAKKLSQVDLLEGDGDIFHRLKSKEKVIKITDGPLITIIMPAFNAEKTIGYALRSLLEQTWENIEILVVDDCSTDSTFDVAKKVSMGDSRVSVFQNSKNVGPYVGKNSMLKLASGKFLTGHDADDWAHPQRIERQLDKIQGRVKATISSMIRVTSEKSCEFKSINSGSPDGILRIASISFFIETSYFKDVLGAWDCVKYSADSELIARAEKILGDRLIYDHNVSMLCLNHENSLTGNPETGVAAEGLSPTRKLYHVNYTNFHAEAAIEDLKYKFPQSNRPFEAPSQMIVSFMDKSN